MSNLLLRRRMLMQAGGSPTPPTPVTPHPFSVSANKQVYFSLGNLQWSATGGGTTPTTHTTADGVGEGTWRFAEHQWDIIGSANANKSSSYSGWIDLFGYGTTGYNGVQPYLNVADNSQYAPYNLVNNYYDWGIYNDIYNPQTGATDIAGTWRLPTKTENIYIYNTRSTTSSIRYAKATVNGRGGVILLPDDWNGTYVFTSPNTANADYSVDVLTLSDFAVLEQEGAIFIPVSGMLYNATMYFNTNNGYYWLPDWYNSTGGYNCRIRPNAIDLTDGNYKYNGLPVRLVKDVI